MLVCATAATLGLCAVVVATAWEYDSPLGAPPYWAWVLTGLQVVALWAAGSGRRWGWLLGGSVQLPWITYAVVTTQFGFIPGCVVSASVQLYSWLSGVLDTATMLPCLSTVRRCVQVDHSPQFDLRTADFGTPTSAYADSGWINDANVRPRFGDRVGQIASDPRDSLRRRPKPGRLLWRGRSRVGASDQGSDDSMMLTA